MVDRQGPWREKSEVNGTEAKSWRQKMNQKQSNASNSARDHHRPLEPKTHHFWFFGGLLSETQTRKAAQE